MNHLHISFDALRHNIEQINAWMEQHGATWTLVTKVLCGNADALRALEKLSIKSVGDSRLENLEVIRKETPSFETWYLRPPAVSAIPETVALSDVSLDSEIDICKVINDEAKRQDKIHGIIVMIELGDLREGILPGNLIEFYSQIFHLSNLTVLGIGANLGCLSGAVPSIDQMMQLILYRELLELKFNHKLPMISAGSTAVLPLLLEKRVPKSINHFRIGEAVFLGSDLIHGGCLEGMRNDVITVSGEIVEIKEKSLVPLGEQGNIAPFEALGGLNARPGQRGYRALVSLGQLDTDVGGMTAVNPDYSIVGASSDLTVVHLGSHSNGLKIGDMIDFRVNYAGLLRLMNGNFIRKSIS